MESQMKSYISAHDGGYYEGDQVHALDEEVPQRPSSSHTWADGAWSVDPKIAHNAPIDAQIEEIETTAVPTKRGQREVNMALAVILDRLNMVIGEIETALRNAGQMVTLTKMPDLKKNSGMKALLDAEAAIKALRAQRV